MTWRVVNASQAGTAHELAGTRCEDSSWAYVHILPSQQPLLSMFVSDGAGSAAKGGEGADLTIESAATFVIQAAKRRQFELGDALATELVLAVRDRIYEASEAANLAARDFACTLVGVLSSPQGTLVLQVGDGGVVLDAGDGLELAITPMSGEYANMTRFVTDEDAIAVLETKTYPGPALKVAAFTDGLQRLALHMDSSTPHEPFFSPFFHGVQKSSKQQEDELERSLLRFLGSQPVNERTDDDKTLAIAVWIHDSEP